MGKIVISIQKIEFLAAWGLVCAVVFSGNVLAADSAYEQPIVMSAASILPANVLAGPNHRVGEQVTNDGFLNIYTIESKYGQIRAVSNDILHQRIAELNAMAGMEKVRGTDEFKEGLMEKAGDFVEGGVALIKDPLGAVSGAVSGVASIFRSVSKTLEYGRSETESSRLSALTGFAHSRLRKRQQLPVILRQTGLSMR